MSRLVKYFRKATREEEGITGLETAIILIAFVVVATVFAFVVLSTGLFSSERGKEAVYAGLQKTEGSLELRGSVIANTDGTTVTSIVFDLANAAGGAPSNLDPARHEQQDGHRLPRRECKRRQHDVDASTGWSVTATTCCRKESWRRSRWTSARRTWGRTRRSPSR